MQYILYATHNTIHIIYNSYTNEETQSQKISVICSSPMSVVKCYAHCTLLCPQKTYRLGSNMYVLLKCCCWCCCWWWWWRRRSSVNASRNRWHARKSGIWVGNDLRKAKNIQTRIMETGEFQRNNGDSFNFLRLLPNV